MPRGFVIGICDVADGDAFRTIFSPDPVGIRQVDANGCRWIFITTEHRCTNDLRGNAPHRFLFKGIIDRRMVFKPLRILTDKLRALGCFVVFIFHQPFPGTF